MSRLTQGVKSRALPARTKESHCTGQEATRRSRIGELGAIDVVIEVQSDEGGRPSQTQAMHITHDFGAVEVVAPPTFATDYKIRPSPGSRSGAKFRRAIAHVVASQGEKDCVEGGRTKREGHRGPSGRCHQALGVNRQDHEKRRQHRVV